MSSNETALRLSLAGRIQHARRHALAGLNAPQQPGVYALFHRDVDDVPFYVGKAENPGILARIRLHHQKLAELAKEVDIPPSAFSFSYLVLSADIPRAENLLRAQFKPAFDRSGFGCKPGPGGVQKPGWLKLLATYAEFAKTFDY